VLIARDLNEHNYTIGLLSNLQSKLGLVPAANILQQSTYIRGNQCLDHVMATPKMIDGINDITYLDYRAELYTEHKPIFMSLIPQVQERTALPNPNNQAKSYSQATKKLKKILNQKV
jgi:hypothetical protein